ncbi:CLUMA_CG009056, isoform A [Clunio marinus]|uniref:Dolichyl-diphosphooligosaccharide--protein glycosyltransferase subunit 2 n=1 Tax=Clunio marinus TaxID=568069 RepID=A0A1J1I5M4_9DIPT|nr:CLUMA_CG009056, isoform A [Clunio marinus]
MKLLGILSVYCFLIASINATRTVDNFLSQSDVQKLQNIYNEGLKSNDLQSIYYSVINSKAIPADVKANLCKKLSTIHTESKLNDFEKNFYYIGASTSLLCSEKLPANLITQLKSSFDKEFSSTQEMFYNFYAQKALDPSVFQESVKTKLSKNLQAIFKKDDSLASLGYGFYIASELGSLGSFAFDRIEDAIAQSDEVDGKMLQFEGGLSITSLVVNGAFKVATINSKPAPLTSEQATKFATYFLSRRSVTTAKGASVLMESLKTISEQKSITPIAIRIADNGQLQPESPILKIRITNLLGEVLKEKPAAVKVAIKSKTSIQKVVDGENLAPVAADLTLYKLELASKKLPKGQYSVEVVAGEFKQPSLSFTILGKVRLDKVEVTIADIDSQSPSKKVLLEGGKKFPEIYSLDHQQKIGLRFDIFDDQTNKVISVHQAFVRFTEKSGEEIIFIAEQDVAKAYKFEMDKRPPRFVSDLFTGLCFAPVFVLFILWGRLGINCSNFSFSLSALGFHGGLGLIFSLFLCFWLQLDMFQTIKYLLPLALFTFLCGNKVLRYIASKRLEKPAKE